MENDILKDIEEMQKGLGLMKSDDKPDDADADADAGVDSDADTDTDITADTDSDTQAGTKDDTDTSTTDDSDSSNDTDDRDQVIASLRSRIEELESKKQVSEPADKKPDADTKPKPEPATVAEQNFLGDLDPDDLIRDPAEFNKLLNKIYQQAIVDARKTITENVFRSIPEIVQSNITIMSELKQASEEFYNQNEDLKPFKKVVAAVFEEVASENPGKSYRELLPLVGEEARKRLELHKKSTDQSPPRLPRKRGKSTVPKEPPATDPLLAELEAMNKSLRR